MLSVDEALAHVLQAAQPLPAEEVPVTAALGQVLAEDVASDLDSPPFDKSLRDGYALRTADFAAGTRELIVVEEVVAGAVPTVPVAAGQAARIMTGAPLPKGADCVVMFEETESVQGDGLGRVRINTAAAPAGQWIMRQGESMRAGDVVLPGGTAIGVAEAGLLSEVGRVQVQAHRRPRVALLPTGDEIVDPSVMPAPGQIRNSNGPMMAAGVISAGAIGLELGVGPDDEEQLRALMARGLESDVFLLNGGVSAGTRDLVPELLKELGVTAIFHHVRMKPGKPLLFGTRPRDHGPPVLVFGLPGNPVSGLVCFELFVRPALRRLLGHPTAGPQFVQARLTAEFAHRGDRPTYHPAQLQSGAEGWEVTPVSWQGSPDLRGVTRGNALASFPAGDRTFAAGAMIAVLALS